jgi:hypothetical protein
LEQQGIDTRIARKLSKHFNEKDIAEVIPDPVFRPMQIPWLMGGTKFNNISAGTSLVALVAMIEGKLLKANQPHLVLGYGIGSVIQADVWRFNA